MFLALEHVISQINKLALSYFCQYFVAPIFSLMNFKADMTHSSVGLESQKSIFLWYSD